MSDTTHTLHLVAKLDTSDVQQKLNQLNSKRAQQAGTAGTAGMPNGGYITPLSQLAHGRMLQKSITSLENNTSKMLNDISNTLMMNVRRINRQSKDLNRMVEGDIRKFILDLGRMPTEAEMEKFTSAEAFKAKKIIDLRGVKDAKRLGISRKTAMAMHAQSLLGGADATERQIAMIQKEMADAQRRTSAGLHQQAIADAQRRTSAGLHQRAIALYKNPLVKTGAAFLGSRVMTGTGELLEASGHGTAGGIVTGFGRITQQAAEMAGIGGMLGAKGALLGGILGGAIGAVDELFTHFTKKATEAREKLEKQIADITASNAKMRAWREEQHLEKLSSGSLTSASAAEEEARAQVDAINRKIRLQEWKTSEDLQKLFEDRGMWQRRLSTAEQRASWHVAQQEALTGIKENASDQLGALTWQQRVAATQAWKARVHNEDTIDVFRRLFGNATGSAQEWARKRAAALEDVQHAVTPEEAQSYMKEAARAAAMQSQFQQQETYFKSDLIGALNEKLQNLSHVDTTPVTSLGQHGYFMGEKNDTAERQLELMERQADIQREIKDILQSDTSGVQALYA